LKDDAALPEQPSVSVIVPVYNDPGGLRRCLAALAAQTYPHDRFEVLVVDNGSAAAPGFVAEVCPRARLLVEPLGGSYAARNHGAAQAQGEVLAFTDADCEPLPAWIEQGVRALLAGNGRVAAGGRIALSCRDPEHPTAAELYEKVFGFNQRYYVETSHYAVTANLFTTREVFQRVGPFDAALTTGGDTEWGRRAYAAGTALVYAPDAVVRHPARRTVAELKAKLKRVTVGQCRLAGRGGAFRQRGIVKLIKILPSVRYKLLPVLRSPHLTTKHKLRVLPLIPVLHFYEYGQRLMRLHCLFRRDKGWNTVK